MNQVVNPVDQIRPSVDPSTVASLGGVNGVPLSGIASTSLADQFNFSSLLKTFVETPQEALAAVQGNKKNLRQDPSTP